MRVNVRGCVNEYTNNVYHVATRHDTHDTTRHAPTGVASTAPLLLLCSDFPDIPPPSLPNVSPREEAVLCRSWVEW